MVPATFAALICAAHPPPLSGQEAADCGGPASLQVTIVDESGSIRLAGATVVVRWSDLVELPVRTTAGVDGRFLLCVPEDAEGATLWAEFGDHSSRQATVTFEAGTTREVVLRILSDGAGSGRLLGLVLDALTDAPVVTAAVSIRGRPAVVDTNRRGRFVLAGVPAGEHVLEVRRIGYAPLRHSITVDRGHTTEVEVGLVPAPVEMEPIVATATRLRRLEIKGFYERKHWGELLGLGYFLTADDIERWRPLTVSAFVAMMVPGMSGLTNRRMSAGFSGKACPMKVLLDGIKVGGELDFLVKPVEVSGIEVYKGPASLPGEFAGSDARCGAVVVWTK